MNYQKIVETCSHIINSGDYMNRYLAGPAAFLVEMGVTDSEDQEGINQLLIPVADFRQLQVNSYKPKTDYNKKMLALFNLVYDDKAAAIFEGSPYQYLNNAGVFTPEDQQQIIDLLTPVKEFQQLLVKYREARNDYSKKIACLQKLLHSEEDKNLYKNNPYQYLALNGITNTEDQQELISLLAPAEDFQKSIAKSAMDQITEINNVNSSYRQGLSKANYQTIKGFHATMTMYIVSFYLGVALLITAIVFAIFAKSSLFAIVFGSIGTLDLLTFFIAKPPLSLQQSRSEQAKLNAAFYSWFTDLYNWNSFYLQFSQKGQTIDFGIMKQVSDAQIANTEKLMQIISAHINTAT